MVAAATMSLPERAREGRNYDYRYVWIRDQCYAGEAVAKAGAYPLLDDTVRFVSERLLEHGSSLKPAYTTIGGRVPDERSLELPGYPGGSDRVGNWVNEQFQLDAFGEALLLFAASACHDHLDVDGRRAADAAAQAIEERWRESDAGIWEVDPDHWTHSRLICVAGCERSAHLVPAVSKLLAGSRLPMRSWPRPPRPRSIHLAAGSVRRVTRLDAALLLPAIRGAIPADDPRTLATLAAFERELTADGYAYRFRPDERPLGEAEGAFLLCGFIMSLAKGQQGEWVDAARWFERNRAACGPPGLFSEEFDVTQRHTSRELPQAFVHALPPMCG